MEQNKVTELLEWLHDVAILLGSIAAIIILVTVSAGIAEWLWGVMGRLGIESPISPFFSIAAMVLIDAWVCFAVLTRALHKRWPWQE